jgi:xanthine dehydrogenase accessory factor
MSLLVLLRGGGDLASGVALRLFRCGIQVIIVELPRPLTVRRSVSFAQAVFNKKVTVEGIDGVLVSSPTEIWDTLKRGHIPITVDPDASSIKILRPAVLVDARMIKQAPETGMGDARLVIGLGPGFTAGLDCHAVVETQRGHFLGRVIWNGQAEKDTRVPESVLNHQSERVLRAPADGSLQTRVEIGESVRANQVLADVGGQPIIAPFDGILRGMVHDGLQVTAGMKIGDLDPRLDERLVHCISDKSLAVGGGVLEAILSRRELLDDYCKK